MSHRRLGPEEIRDGLSRLVGWELTEAARLRRELRFPDFVTAWGFMNSVALEAQAMDHHPDWCNVYGTVRIELSTHDAGGVTELDLELARRIDRILAS